MKWIFIFVCGLMESISIAQPIGYKIVGGKNNSALKNISGDFGLDPHIADQLSHSPELEGYLLGLTVYYQMPSLPFFVGGFMREKVAKSSHVLAESKSLTHGIEMSAWYPHSLLQPYVLAGFGVKGTGTIKAYYEDENSDDELLLKGEINTFYHAFGVKMPSSSQLSASLHWELGYEFLQGNLYNKSREDLWLYRDDVKGNKRDSRVYFATRNHVLLVGIDYLMNKN